MTMSELRKAIESVLPSVQLDEDNEGQIIVYTNLMIDPSSSTHEVVEYEEENGTA